MSDGDTRWMKVANLDQVAPIRTLLDCSWVLHKSAYIAWHDSIQQWPRYTRDDMVEREGKREGLEERVQVKMRRKACMETVVVHDARGEDLTGRANDGDEE